MEERQELLNEKPNNTGGKETKLKKVLVSGSSGFVGNYLLKYIAT